MFLYLKVACPIAIDRRNCAFSNNVILNAKNAYFDRLQL